MFNTQIAFKIHCGRIFAATLITGYPLAEILGDQSLLVSQTGQLITTNDSLPSQAFQSEFGLKNVLVTILGTMARQIGVAINVTASPVSGTVNDVVTIGQTGLVTSDANHATIVMGGDGNIINTAGSVLGGPGLWLWGYGGGSVTNSGQVTSQRFEGICLLSGTDTVTSNTGSIHGVAGISLLESTGHIYIAGLILSTHEARAGIDG